mmetsp:Transcript_16114/g.18135  ORF Transcript_16114/g.18135 Transcript_16114/m.18135 type:complete len:89 (-) Transcript_16114:104-370(-)
MNPIRIPLLYRTLLCTPPPPHTYNIIPTESNSNNNNVNDIPFKTKRNPTNLIENRGCIDVDSTPSDNDNNNNKYPHYVASSIEQSQPN